MLCLASAVCREMCERDEEVDIVCPTLGGRRWPILNREMSLLRRLALRVGQELAKNPNVRAKAAQVLTKTQQMLNDDVKPRAEQAWRDAQPEIERTKHRLKRVAHNVREEYRKGRDGE